MSFSLSRDGAILLNVLLRNVFLRLGIDGGYGRRLSVSRCQIAGSDNNRMQGTHGSLHPAFHRIDPRQTDQGSSDFGAEDNVLAGAENMS